MYIISVLKTKDVETCMNDWVKSGIGKTCSTTENSRQNMKTRVINKDRLHN